MSLSQVRKTVFNPLLQTKDEISQYLKSLPNNNGTAHPFEKSLLLLENDQIVEVDISDKEESFFFSATDLNTLSETISQRIDLYPTQLPNMKEYTIISLVNPYLEIPFVPDEKVIVVLSVRDPTFYDFCLGNANGDMVLFCNLNHNGLRGFKHSGDNNNGNNLLQYVTFGNDIGEDPFALFVSGYSNNALHKYKPQNPAVTICDHANKIMYVVPVPLDQATIGDATLCVPVIGRRRGDKLCFSVLPSAVTSDQVATGGGQLGGDTLARAVAREPPPPTATVGDTTTTPASGTTEKPDKKKLKPDVEAVQESMKTVEVDVGKPLFVTEEGCTFPEFAKGKDGNHISFFQGITVHSKQPEDVNTKDKMVVLPCPLGNELEGSMILALGKPFSGASVTYDQYQRLFDRAPMVLLTVSDRMSDQARVLNPDIRCNGLYIVQRQAPIEQQSNLSVEDMLNDTKINAITALSGPQSVVVVQLGERYYFYRGIRWPGLFEEVPKFGEDITEAIEGIFDIEMSKQPWNNIVSIAGDPQVYFRGAISSPDELHTNFTSLKLEELEAFKPDILDTLAQLQVVMSPKELPEFTSRLQNSLKEIMEDSFADYKKEYIEAVLASRGQNRDPKLMEKYRRAEKQAKVAVQWLIDALGALVSSRISSTRKYDLKQMIRKQKILDNVAASKDMTYESLGGLLEEHCTEIGMVISNIESETFKSLLRNVKDANLLAHLQGLPSTAEKVCQLDDRVQYLSGLDSGIILPLSQANHDGPLARKVGELALGFPRGLSSDGEGSAFAFACFDQFINIRHPYSQFWVDLCNLHHVSMFRILQRNTVSSAIQSREFEIPPASKDLGFLLAYSLTDTMKSLAATRSGVPKEAKFGEDVDTTTKMMRGLFGYLMTLLAAGVQPMSMAWQMLSKTQSLEAPPKDEFWLYRRIIDLFPYTAWPQAQFKKNVRTLVARLLRKQITDPVTKPLRDSMAQMKQDELKEYIRKRNIQLKWCEVAVEILSKLLVEPEYKADTEKVKGVAERLIALIPAEEVANKKGKRGLWRTMRVFEKLKESGDVTKINEDTRLSAAHTYAKRSAALKDLKENLVEAAEKSPEEAKKAYDELQAGRREIAAKFTVDNVKIQNHKNIDKIIERLGSGEKIEKKELLSALKSDAEIYREPWLVGKPEDPEPSKMHFVHYILTEEVTAPTDNDKSKEVIIEKPKSLSERLSMMPGGDKAGKLAVVVEKIKDTDELLKIAKLPEDDFMQMYRFSKGTDEDEVETLKKVIVMYLEGWADVVATEGKVVAYLRGIRGQNEEKDIKEADAKAGVKEEPKEETQGGQEDTQMTG